jgi:hypothetical protein
MHLLCYSTETAVFWDVNDGLGEIMCGMKQKIMQMKEKIVRVLDTMYENVNGQNS